MPLSVPTTATHPHGPFPERGISDVRLAARSLGDLVVAPARAVGHLREGEGGGGGVLLPLVQVDGADDGELEHEDEEVDEEE